MEGHGAYDRNCRPFLALWPIPGIVGIVFPVIFKVFPCFLALSHWQRRFFMPWRSEFEYFFIVGVISCWDLACQNIGNGGGHGICRILSGHDIQSQWWGRGFSSLFFYLFKDLGPTKRNFTLYVFTKDMPPKDPGKCDNARSVSCRSSTECEVRTDSKNKRGNLHPTDVGFTLHFYWRVKGFWVNEWLNLSPVLRASW